MKGLGNLALASVVHRGLLVRLGFCCIAWVNFWRLGCMDVGVDWSLDNVFENTYHHHQKIRVIQHRATLQSHRLNLILTHCPHASSTPDIGGDELAAQIDMY